MSKPKVVSAPPCPFWRAAATDQNVVDPNAPAPIAADKPGSIARAIEHLMYHGGFSKVKATAIAELLVVAANKGTVGKLKAVFKQSYVLNELSDGLLDKELDTGILRRVDEDGVEHVGEFSEEALAIMFQPENASEVMVEGCMQLAMTKQQLATFVENKRQSLHAGQIHTIMANAEMTTLLLGIFGRTADNGEKVITHRDMFVLYRHGIFPHARLDSSIAEVYPTASAQD